jgi:phosphoglycolate phosphatase
MKPKIIIFDFDGTLGDTRHNIILTLQATMRDRGLELRSEEECAATIGLTLLDSFRTMYPSMSDEDAEACVKHYRDIFYRSIEESIPQLFPGVAPTLERLRDMGVVMSIASSRSSPSLLLFIRSMGIADHFSLVLGSDSVENHKPHPEPVLKTLEKLVFKPSEAIVVGDMPVDIVMARNASVPSVGVSYGNATREELIAAGADYVIDNFAELLNIIK